MTTRRSLIARAAALLAAPFARIVGAAPTAEGLPPLPTPDQPADQIVPALIAWLGGPESAASYLAADLEFDLQNEEGITTDDYFRLVPLIKVLQERPRRPGDKAHGERLREAILRHGYDRLPLPPGYMPDAE